jgi:hypothetical protein
MNQSKNKNLKNDCFDRILFFLLVPGLSFSLASWMYLTIPENYRTELRFRSRALLTSGIVTQKNQKITGCVIVPCSSSCDMTVSFQTSEGEIIDFPDNCTSAQENQIVPILYDPSSLPVKARVDVGDTPESRATNQQWYSLMFALFGVGSIAIGFSDLIKNAKNN